MPAKVSACRILRDLERTDAPSRGYGFVEFQSHAHALAALRWINNNPAFSSLAQGGDAAIRQRSDEEALPRLIVEFAVENKGKLQVQEKRRETSQKREEQRKVLPDAERLGAGDEGAGGRQTRGGAPEEAQPRPAPA